MKKISEHTQFLKLKNTPDNQFIYYSIIFVHDISK